MAKRVCLRWTDEERDILLDFMRRNPGVRDPDRITASLPQLSRRTPAAVNAKFHELVRTHSSSRPPRARAKEPTAGGEAGGGGGTSSPSSSSSSSPSKRPLDDAEVPPAKRTRGHRTKHERDERPHRGDDDELDHEDEADEDELQTEDDEPRSDDDDDNDDDEEENDAAAGASASDHSEDEHKHSTRRWSTGASALSKTTRRAASRSSKAAAVSSGRQRALALDRTSTVSCTSAVWQLLTQEFDDTSVRNMVPMPDEALHAYRHNQSRNWPSTRVYENERATVIVVPHDDTVQSIVKCMRTTFPVRCITLVVTLRRAPPPAEVLEYFGVPEDVRQYESVELVPISYWFEDKDVAAHVADRFQVVTIKRPRSHA